MCGIAGMVGPAADRWVVATMTETLRHRGPDGSGLWDAPGVALGHRRLRILDLSDAGRQPMSTSDGRYTIVFNGEVYNYRELRAELPPLPYVSQTDTEVVLQAFAHWGPACLERFVGMFGFAIWDAEKRELFCARDRLGIKPFLFAQRYGHFFFASEVRALLTAGIPARANAEVIYDFLARDFYEHRDETFFRDIYKLPPGHWMIVREGAPQPARSFWNLAEAAGAHEPDPRPVRREEVLLGMASEAVALHLRSDVPIGVALSGGLDSATLLSLLDRCHPDPTKVEAVSFAFADPAYSERPFVEEMAKHTGRRAHFIEVTARAFAENALRHTIAQEEPFAGAPITAYALCFELARQTGFIVMMDGSGMDEALAGYDRFRPALWADLWNQGDFAGLERELTAIGITTSEQRALALSQMQAAAETTADVGKGQDLTNSVRPDCLVREFALAAAPADRHFARPFPDHLRNLMFRELRYTKLPRALRFRDRLSMAVGTELRPPFLDHRLLAYEFSLPPEDRIHMGITKAVLRRAAARLLPDAIRLASKRSVQTPQREWFRGELKDWVRDHVDRASFWDRGWVARSAAREAMEAYFRGEGNNSFFLWQWINLELWAGHYLDRSHASLSAREWENRVGSSSATDRAATVVEQTPA